MMRSDANAKSSDTVLAVVMAVAMVIGIALGLATRPRPMVAPATSPPQNFSAERALAHVREIAKKPHPTGTQENAEVADYLVRQIASLGLKPEIQETAFTTQNRAKDFVVVQVRNVLARIEGTGPDSEKAVLLLAHYDSVPGSPGASDDGAGVAVLLESMRALLASSKPAHDVIFLFTDAEELGTYGAKAFMAQHPWSKDVAIALNFEARGTTGPVVMFETGNKDGWLVREFLKGAPNPYANSLATVLYRYMASGTDFGVLRQAGVSGLNFAFAEGLERYHSGRDSLEFLDPRSLQHEGDYALALAQRLGNADFSQRPRYTGTYFNLIGSFSVFYPTSWALAFTLVVLLLYFVALFLARRRAGLSWKGAALAGAASLVAVVLAAAPVAFVLAAATGRGGGPLLYASGYIYIAVIAYSITIFLVALNFCRKRTNVISIFLGAMLLWIILMAAITVVAPDAAYVLQWPGLLACVLAIGMIWRGQGQVHGTYLIVGCVAAAVGIGLLLAPPIDSLHIALPLQFWVTICVAVVLALILFIPQFDTILRRARWRVPAGAFAIVAVCTVAAVLTHYDDERPQPNHVFYVANADTKDAIWLTQDEKADVWTRQFFPNPKLIQSLNEYLPDWYTGGGNRGRSQELTNTAPFLIDNQPEVSVVSDETINGVRRLLLHVRSSRKAPNVSVRVHADGGILESAAGDQKTEQVLAGVVATPSPETPAKGGKGDAANQGPRKNIVFVYYGLPTAGATLTVGTKPGDKIEVEVIDRSFDLPTIANQQRPARPRSVFQARSYVDSTLVRRSFTF